MTVKKYRYYFKKPKSEIVKDILSGIAIAGALSFIMTCPYFAKSLLDICKKYKKWKKYPKKKFIDTFYNLKKQGLIEIQKKNNQIYIYLTEKGKKKADWMQINDLKIRKPKTWDRKWRIIIFDIAELKKIYREALRGKLKELGIYPVQKSVWICPFDCRAEIELLKDFFGLSDDELRIIIAENIGNDEKFKKIFNL